MTVIMVCVVTVMLLIWLLLGSWVDYCSAGIWVKHTGAKSECEKVTLFDSDCDDGVSAGIWVIHTGAKSGSYIISHSEVTDLGAKKSHFLTVTVMMV